MKDNYDIAKKALRKKYIGWLDQAIGLAEEEGLFIGAAFSQIAYEERKNEIRKEAVEDYIKADKNDPN